MPHRRLAVAGLVLLVAGSACRRATEEAADAPQAPVVSVVAARLGTLRDTATAPGTVVPAATGDLTVYANEPAEIAELPGKDGDVVNVGDVLVRFEVASVTQSLAALQLDSMEASAAADRARAELARQTSYLERGLTSRNAYDASRSAVSTAESAAAAAKARLDAIAANPERTLVTARFPGRILKTWHIVGDAVRPSPDDPILRVIDPSRVQVSVQLPIALLARVVPGQAATIAPFGAPAEAGVVAAKMATTSPDAPTGEVRLGFSTPSALALDSPVSTEILFDQRTNALLVPAGALGRDSLGSFVFIAGDDLRAHRRDVRLGLATTEAAQIVSGLTAGENVIVSGRSDLTDGAPFVVSR